MFKKCLFVALPLSAALLLGSLVDLESSNVAQDIVGAQILQPIPICEGSDTKSMECYRHPDAELPNICDDDWDGIRCLAGNVRDMAYSNMDTSWVCTGDHCANFQLGDIGGCIQGPPCAGTTNPTDHAAIKVMELYGL